jgi:hypothetical protein
VFRPSCRYFSLSLTAQPCLFCTISRQGMAVQYIAQYIRTKTKSPSGFGLKRKKAPSHFLFLKRCLCLAHWVGIHVNYCRNRRCALQRHCTKNSKWNCAASFLGIHKSDLLCSVVCELFVVLIRAAGGAWGCSNGIADETAGSPRLQMWTTVRAKCIELVFLKR